MLVLYLIAINLWSLYVMGDDKKRARANRRRVPERTLFLLAMIGGSLGIWLGMYVFRHKTRKRMFVVGIPILAVLLLLFLALYL